MFFVLFVKHLQLALRTSQCPRFFLFFFEKFTKKFLFNLLKQSFNLLHSFSNSVRIHSNSQFWVIVIWILLSAVIVFIFILLSLKWKQYLLKAKFIIINQYKSSCLKLKWFTSSTQIWDWLNDFLFCFYKNKYNFWNIITN